MYRERMYDFESLFSFNYVLNAIEFIKSIESMAFHAILRFNEIDALNVII